MCNHPLYSLLQEAVMRWKLSVALCLLNVVPAVAQEKAAAPAVPPGWTLRLDKSDAPAPPKFFPAGDGLHVTSGPAAIYYQPAQHMKGDFRISATFTQTRSPKHPEAVGLFIGGKNLDNAAQEYGYLIVRGDGKYAVKHRAGDEVHIIQDWTEHSGVKKQDAAGKATNTLAIEAIGAKVRMLVNGAEVQSFERRNFFPTSGLLGMRINHELDVHISDFKVEPILDK
jgi:hypothetical protein